MDHSLACTATKIHVHLSVLMMIIMLTLATHTKYYILYSLNLSAHLRLSSVIVFRSTNIPGRLTSCTGGWQ